MVTRRSGSEAVVAPSEEAATVGQVAGVAASPEIRVPRAPRLARTAPSETEAVKAL
jgi:hypothetical protein